MAPKRKNSNPPMEEGSSAEFANLVYLVAEHEGEQSAYSVLKIDASAAINKPPRARAVAGLPGTARGMAFVAAHSKHGSWIVGVGGGMRAGTIIFDPNTLETYQGPLFLHPKHDPVLLSHRGEVYAISRRPMVVPDLDFEPWFESLSFNKGVPSTQCAGGVRASWRRLPPPPFFPSSLNPFQFRNPPQISVASYAALGSHILLSPQQVLSPDQQLIRGTYAFHVVNQTWDKLTDENLPFVGQAVPLGLGGGHLFVACPALSPNNNGASASMFHMSIKVSSLSTLPSLSIQEFPVTASEGKIPKLLFCPLGKKSFCSIMLESSCRSRNKPKGLEVILTAFQIDNIEMILTACQSLDADAKVLQVAVQVKEQRHTYKSKRRSHVLDSDTPVVAALSMDTANVEVLDDGKTTKTRGRQTTDSTTSEVPVIRYCTQSESTIVLLPEPTKLLRAS